MISDVRSGAIVGMEWKKPVTGDLAKDGAARYAQLRAGDEVTVLQAHHGDLTDGAQCVHPSE